MVQHDLLAPRTAPQSALGSCGRPAASPPTLVIRGVAEPRTKLRCRPSLFFDASDQIEQPGLSLVQVILTCSPKTDPRVMRVPWAQQGQGAVDETDGKLAGTDS